MKNTKNILFMILIFAFVINTKAQDKIILENDRIEDVIDSDKPYIKIPYQEVSEDDLPKINFESQDLYVESDFDPEPPAPKVLEQKPKEPLKNNFLKVGIGNFITPSVLLSVHSGRKKDLSYGFDFDHLSSHSDPVEYRNFRRDEGRLSLGYALDDDKKIIGSLSIYNTSYFNYADTARTRRGTLQKYEDTIRMGFTQIRLGGHLHRIYKEENQLDYDLGLELSSYSDRRDNSLFVLGLIPHASWAFDEQLSIDFESEFHFENGTIGGLSSSGLFVELSPVLVYQSGDLQLSGGIKWSSATRQGEIKNRSFIAPMAEFRYRLMPHEMTVFAGITGGLKDHHYSDLIRINPYLASAVEPAPTVEKLNIYGGVSGQIPGLLDYNVKVSYRTVENAIVFTVPQDGAFFDVESDSLMTDLGIKLEVNYDLLKSVKIGASVESHSYKMSTLAKNFHAPPLTLKAFAQYKATDKLMIKSSLSFFGSTPMTLDTAQAVINRAVYIDLNAGVDYRINDVFSAWIQVNNLLGTNYQRWWNYKERSIEVRGGISLAF